MKTTLDCYSCFIRIGLQAARLAGADDDTQRLLMGKFLDVLKDATKEDSPLRTARLIQEIVHAHTGCKDPYAAEKDNCNREAEKWLPHLLKEFDEATNKLVTALKIAAIGNIMDYGAFAGFDVSKLIEKLHHNDFAVNCIDPFAEKLQSATTITYFADNTGEIYFDSVLIEYLCQQHSIEKINLVIRSHPFLNDVASPDHLPESLIKHPKVEIHSLPVVRSELNPQLWKQLLAADLVISKGMANFENYSEEPDFYFLLIAKCDLVRGVISEKTGIDVKTNDWIFMHSDNAQNQGK